MSVLKGKNILIGVSSSIAIYKSLELISILKKRGCNIKVAMTKDAQKFISPLVFKALTNNEVYCDVMEEMELNDTNITHIALAKWADLFIVVPATANIIAKMANGLSDDTVSLLALAVESVKIVAPAMNSAMYLNKITQNNLEKLKRNDFKIVEPVNGNLACNTKGVGHIADENDIVDFMESCFYDKILKDKNIIVTAGATLEAIDPVRYITNRSSGKMGFALAKIARFMQADVSLISGHTNLKTPYGVKRIDIESADDMLNALKNLIISMKGKEIILIMAAAVGDFKPYEYINRKIKKKEDETNFILKLTKNKDLTYEINKFAKENDIDLTIIGFAAETNDLIINAKKKIIKKGLEFIVANDISRSDIGFNSNDNEVTIIDKSGKLEKLNKMNKEKLAFEILRRIA